MGLEHWDATANGTYNQDLLDELASLRFVDAGQNALIIGPVGVGKTLPAPDAAATNDFYDLVIEQHRRASTVVTSNRDRLNGSPPRRPAPRPNRNRPVRARCVRAGHRRRQLPAKQRGTRRGHPWDVRSTKPGRSSRSPNHDHRLRCSRSAPSLHAVLPGWFGWSSSRRYRPVG